MLTEIDHDLIASLFHEHYERLAPSFGYETRRDSSVPWDDVPEPNRQLMGSTVAAVLADPRSPVVARAERDRAMSEIQDVCLDASITDKAALVKIAVITAQHTGPRQ